MNTYYYKFDIWDNEILKLENGEIELNVEDATEFESDHDCFDDFSIEWFIEDLCKYVFHNRDGWEYSNRWADSSIMIALWDHNKNFIGKFRTTLEYDPTFSVSKVND